MEKKPIRVLQVQIGGTTFSGVASYLYQYYKEMDHARVHYDFLFCRENSMKLVQDAPSLADSAFYVLNATKGKSNDYAGITRGLRETLKKGNYDIVVVNTSIIAVVYACYLATRRFPHVTFIAHAHNTDLVLGKGSLRAKILPIVKTADKILRGIIRRKADYLFACTKEAGRITFGEKVDKQNNYFVVRNAIVVEDFTFDPAVRKRIRDEQGVKQDKVIYGNVGSFSKRKNHIFLLDIYKCISEKEPDSELWLIGDGKEKETIEKRIHELDLSESVKLLGQKENVNEYMQGMDCFVFPTLSEGLGIVAIEAQAAGLPTFVSDGVPHDVMITDLAVQLKLGEGKERWASAICERAKNDRKDMSIPISEAGYDLHSEADKLTELLESIT